MPLRKPQKPAGQASQRQKLIEEYILLDREVQDFKPRIYRHEKLRQLILDWYPSVSPEEEITVPAENCDIVISSRDKVRSVSAEGKKKLFKLWGPRDFIAKCVMHLKSLPDPEDREGLYTQQAYTGPRHLHIMARVKSAQVA